MTPTVEIPVRDLDTYKQMTEVVHDLRSAEEKRDRRAVHNNLDRLYSLADTLSPVSLLSGRGG